MVLSKYLSSPFTNSNEIYPLRVPKYFCLDHIFDQLLFAFLSPSILVPSLALQQPFFSIVAIKIKYHTVEIMRYHPLSVKKCYFKLITILISYS